MPVSPTADVLRNVGGEGMHETVGGNSSLGMNQKFPLLMHRRQYHILAQELTAKLSTLNAGLGELHATLDGVDPDLGSGKHQAAVQKAIFPLYTDPPRIRHRDGKTQAERAVSRPLHT